MLRFHTSGQSTTAHGVRLQDMSQVVGLVETTAGFGYEMAMNLRIGDRSVVLLYTGVIAGLCASPADPSSAAASSRHSGCTATIRILCRTDEVRITDLSLSREMESSEPHLSVHHAVQQLAT